MTDKSPCINDKSRFTISFDSTYKSSQWKPLCDKIIKISWLILLSNITSSIKPIYTYTCFPLSLFFLSRSLRFHGLCHCYVCRLREGGLSLCSMAQKWYFMVNFQIIKYWNNKNLEFTMKKQKNRMKLMFDKRKVIGKYFKLNVY